ncbi:protein translocase subunit SecD [Pleurocapsa sp. PCC 7319]|uniref:protein translocase subunit SecD n=1 Tax=Pleurocapsa sp. PCC 7319 TaxID=118161 RepID=UPI00034B71B2|nr:protein translocase subunit SecD [Pleurocapsa sp. PCC 7319]
MQKQRAYIILILALVAAAIAILTTIPPQLGLDLRGGAQLTIQVNPTKEQPDVKPTPDDVEAVQRVLENRINEFGVSETTVQTIGEDKILIQLPGESEPQEAERRLKGTAKLEFKQQKQGSEGDFAAESQVRQQLKVQQAILSQGDLKPSNQEKLAEVTTSLQKSNQAIAGLFESVGLTGTNLTDARPQPDATGNRWEVAINFDDPGGKKFAELTKNLAGTGRSIGIFLDDELISSPVVGPEFADRGIAGGRAVITGNFDLEGAKDLAIQIKGGSLPFPVSVVENRTVGATLGQDSIRRSIIAACVGLVLVLIFMAVYYRLPGIIADGALIVYALLTLGCYALVGVTLTLPGIAGFILSIGMAVDANVLIFERTREELRAGKTLYRSVESGFFRAFSSILDSNVTTAIACLALLWLGSGLVKGFAITLLIGVIVSMFTAVTCSRTLMLLTVLSLPKVRQKPELFCPNLDTAANNQ